MDRIQEIWGESPGSCLAAALVIAAIWLVVYYRGRRTPRSRVVLVSSSAIGVMILLVLLLVQPLERWGWALALLPAVMVLQHAVFLRMVRMPFRIYMEASSRAGESKECTNLWEAMGVELKPIFAAARRNSDRYFSPSTLAIRYGIPAVAIALIGLVVFYLLFIHYGETPDPNLRAAKLGIAGAYVYILLYLGQRNFRQDVTSGGAMWCAVLLAIGPVLAWAISHFSHGDFSAGAAAQPATSEDVSSELIYFAAGLAPRHVAALVNETIRRVWVSPSNVAMAMPRTIPITQVRGITTDIAERLSEEGILDVHGLANADPLRLIRNTNFDKRQIIAWIDEAILMSVVPDHWQALEKAGFTGAIDVAWLQRQGIEPNDLEDLAQRAKFDSAAILRGVIARLSSDAQLRLVWVLYQLIDHLEAENELGVEPGTVAARA